MCVGDRINRGQLWVWQPFLQTQMLESHLRHKLDAYVPSSSRTYTFPAGYTVFRITRPAGCHQSASTGARDTPERRPYHLARAGPRARAPRRGSYNCARAGQRVLAPRRGTYNVARAGQRALAPRRGSCHFARAGKMVRPPPGSQCPLARTGKIGRRPHCVGALQGSHHVWEPYKTASMCGRLAWRP